MIEAAITNTAAMLRWKRRERYVEAKEAHTMDD
jgi:hypothetical protein